VGLSSTDLRLRVLTDLVEQVVSEALYDTLRTKQQLGYTVSSGARLTHGVTGFCVVVVSAAFDAVTVEQRIEAFMREYEETRLKVCQLDECSSALACGSSMRLLRMHMHTCPHSFVVEELEDWTRMPCLWPKPPQQATLHLISSAAFL
jgi:hypothetical protein